MMRRIQDLGEDALVRRLVTHAPLGDEVVAGPGDDCAVVKGVRKDEWLLLKTDAMVEGVHFESGSPANLVGRKALARVLSDIAAMGATWAGAGDAHSAARHDTDLGRWRLCRVVCDGAAIWGKCGGWRDDPG